MKQYKIENRGDTMVIIDRETREERAEYRLTPGCEAAEIRQMRRALDEHFEDGNATMGNYQW